MTGLTFVATFMALALLVFSGLYLLVSWGLSQQKRLRLATPLRQPLS